MGGGAKIPYPKTVWSPAGGWYAQPANWAKNTMASGLLILGIVAATWTFSSTREKWTKQPEPGRFAPSRHWSRQLKQAEAENKLRSVGKE